MPSQLPLPRLWLPSILDVLSSRNRRLKAAGAEQQRAFWGSELERRSQDGCPAPLVSTATAAAKEVLDAAIALAEETGHRRHVKWLVWDLHVVPSAYLNAATDGVGTLFITTGLLRQHTAGEVAAVLAHEVAHNVARHAAQLKQARMALLPLAVLETMQCTWRAGLAATLAGGSSLLRTIGSGGGTAAAGPGCTVPQVLEAKLKPLRRQLESEADLLAMHLLARAGHLPGQMISYLRAVQAWEDSKPPGTGDGAHPPAWQRIQAAHRHLPEAAAALASRSPRYRDWRICMAAGA